MTTTPNGWTTSPNPATFGGLDNREVPGAPGVHLAPGIRAGDAATIAFHFAGQVHEHVEPLRAGQCWGFAYRPNTNNPRVLTEHAGGAAWDLNAPEHPNGRRGTFSHEQVGILRALLAGYEGLITWGGDFTGTDDEMHFELQHDPAKLARVAARLTAHPAPAVSHGRHVDSVKPAHDGDQAAVAGPHEGNTAREAPAPVVDVDGPEPGYPPPGADAIGTGPSFRAQVGNRGDKVRHLQAELNKDFSLYSQIVEDGIYGDETTAVLMDFARRAATDVAHCPVEHRAALAKSHGDNVGPHLAAVFPVYGIHV